MSKNIKFIVWTTVSIIIVVMIFCLVSYLAFLNSFGKNFVGERDPKYLDYVSDRINFGIVRCDNVLQWDTIQQRINTFLIKNPHMNTPDSLGIRAMSCSGCAVIEESIYFDQEPREIYIANFDMSSFNHIDEIYQVKNGEMISIKTTTLTTDEKERIKSRLQTEMLDKINWNIQGIEFQ